MKLSWRDVSEQVWRTAEDENTETDVKLVTKLVSPPRRTDYAPSSSPSDKDDHLKLTGVAQGTAPFSHPSYNPQEWQVMVIHINKIGHIERGTLHIGAWLKLSPQVEPNGAW